MKDEEKPGKQTVLFSTDSGIIALNSPIKIKILELLRQETKSFEELVEHTGKAKSTISVHLDDLRKQRLIIEETGQKDKRKKYFFLSSQYIAYSQQPISKHYQDVLDKLANSTANEYTFLRSLFHTMRYGLEAYGLEPRPVIKRIGIDIGRKISPLFVSDNLADLLEEISDFWESHRMGYMKIVGGEPTILIVDECFDCGHMPIVGKTLCCLDEGILQGILEGKLNYCCSVEETECYGIGYEHCKFVISQTR